MSKVDRSQQQPQLTPAAPCAHNDTVQKDKRYCHAHEHHRSSTHPLFFPFMQPSLLEQLYQPMVLKTVKSGRAVVSIPVGAAALDPSGPLLPHSCGSGPAVSCKVAPASVTGGMAGPPLRELPGPEFARPLLGLPTPLLGLPMPLLGLTALGRALPLLGLGVSTVSSLLPVGKHEPFRMSRPFWQSTLRDCLHATAVWLLDARV